MNVPPELSPAAWIDLADDDFGVACDLAGLDTNRCHGICFHCQQAVEKYLMFKPLLITGPDHEVVATTARIPGGIPVHGESSAPLITGEPDARPAAPVGGE